MTSSKMVVIPYDKYLKLINENKIKSTINNVNDNILTESKGNLAETYINENIKEGEKISDLDMLTENDILNYMPKSYSHKCKMLLYHMKNNNIMWDSFGRLIIGDECVINSHIVDLIRDVIGNYKRKKFVKISRDFLQLLIASHCPHSILNKNLYQQDEIIK